MYRMVYNSIVFEVLDQYRDGKMTKQQALTKLNELADYVRDNDQSEDNSRDSKNNKR